VQATFPPSVRCPLDLQVIDRLGHHARRHNVAEALKEFTPEKVVSRTRERPNGREDDDAAQSKGKAAVRGRNKCRAELGWQVSRGHRTRRYLSLISGLIGVYVTVPKVPNMLNMLTWACLAPRSKPTCRASEQIEDLSIVSTALFVP